MSHMQNTLRSVFLKTFSSAFKNSPKLNTETIRLKSLSHGQTRKRCCGNIAFRINISLFVHLGKHCCGDKICIPGRKNVSQQIQKHFCCGNNVSSFAHMFSNFSSTRNIVFPIRHVQTIFIYDYSANINNTKIRVSQCFSKMFPSLPTVGNMTKHRQEVYNVSATMFPSLPRAL